MTNVPRMFIVLCERKVTFNIDSIEYVKSLKKVTGGQPALIKLIPPSNKILATLQFFMLVLVNSTVLESFY